MDRQTKIALAVFCGAVVVIMALAAWGYFSGAWDGELSPP